VAIQYAQEPVGCCNKTEKRKKEEKLH